jgi:hypothetical protein
MKRAKNNRVYIYFVNSGIFGTYGFIAPELVRMETHTRMMDVWGVGTLIYFMLYGDKPHLDEA